MLPGYRLSALVVLAVILLIPAAAFAVPSLAANPVAIASSALGAIELVGLVVAGLVPSVLLIARQRAHNHKS